jgi:hypothetical protein
MFGKLIVTSSTYPGFEAMANPGEKFQMGCYSLDGLPCLFNALFLPQIYSTDMLSVMRVVVFPIR